MYEGLGSLRCATATSLSGNHSYRHSSHAGGRRRLKRSLFGVVFDGFFDGFWMFFDPDFMVFLICFRVGFRVCEGFFDRVQMFCNQENSTEFYEFGKNTPTKGLL